MTAECQQYRGSFSEYLDGVLSSAERSTLEAHLSRCDECRRELEAWRQTVRAVAELPARGVPAGFASRVLGCIRAEDRVPARRAVFVLWSRLVPVAAMLLLVLGLTLKVAVERAPERPTEEARLAMATAAPGEERSKAAVRGAEFRRREPAEQRLARGAEVARECLEAQEPVSGREEKGLQVAEKPLEMAAKAPAAPAHVRLREGTGAAVPGKAPQPEAGIAAHVSQAAGGQGPSVAAGALEEGVRTVGGAAGREETEREPALTWGAADRATPKTGAAADLGLLSGRPVGSGFGGDGGLPLQPEEKELLFSQMARAVGPPRGPVQQVLTLVGKDPAGLARQVVVAANRAGVAATLSLRQDESGGTMEVHLSVPVARYRSLLEGLAALTPPEQQALENTAAADAYFFVAALGQYKQYQNVRMQAKKEHEAKEAGAVVAGVPTTTAGPGAEPLRAAGAAGVSGGVRGVEPKLETPAGPVNLMVRIEGK